MKTIYTREEEMHVSHGLGDVEVRGFAATVDDNLADYLCQVEPHNYSMTPFVGTVPAKETTREKKEAE